MKYTFIAPLFFFCGFALAQDAPKLILETTPEETEIELKDVVSIGTDGSITATPVDPSVCQATESCEGVTATVTEFGSASASNGTITVNEGDSFALSWRSSGATTCTPKGDFAEWIGKTTLPTDSRDSTTSQTSVTTSAGDADNSPYELQIQCSNGSVISPINSDSSLTLVVDEVVAPSPTSCVGREPISGWTRLTTGTLSCRESGGTDFSADCREWSPNLWANSFLGSSGQSQKILTNVSDSRQYIAVQFDTNGMTLTASGRLKTESPGASIRSERLLATISKCPGDFNPDQVTGCYLSPSVFSSFRWRAPNSSSTTSCVLEPDTVYYLNMLSTNSALGTQPNEIEPISACNDSKCGVLLTPRVEN